MVDRGLGARDLQLVENHGELGDLAFVELELVREKTQRAAHAEAAPSELVAAAGRPSTEGAAVPLAMPEVTAHVFLRTAAHVSTRRATARVPPRERMHCRTFLPRLVAPGGSAERARCRAHRGI